MTKIIAPTRVTGPHTYGPVTLTFTDGVAEHTGDLPAGLVAWLHASGYEVGSPKRTRKPAEQEAPHAD